MVKKSLKMVKKTVFIGFVWFMLMITSVIAVTNQDLIACWELSVNFTKEEINGVDFTQNGNIDNVFGISSQNASGWNDIATDYLSVNNGIFNNSNDFSVGCVVQPNMTTPEKQLINQFGNPTANQRFTLYSDNGASRWEAVSNGGGQNCLITASGNYPAGVWQEVFVTFNSSSTTGSLYVNGVFNGSDTSCIANPTSASDVMIGRRADGATRWIGGIGTCFWFNRTLTQQDTEDLWNDGDPLNCTLFTPTPPPDIDVTSPLNNTLVTDNPVRFDFIFNHTASHTCHLFVNQTGTFTEFDNITLNQSLRETIEDDNFTDNIGFNFSQTEVNDEGALRLDRSFVNGSYTSQIFGRDNNQSWESLEIEFHEPHSLISIDFNEDVWTSHDEGNTWDFIANDITGGVNTIEIDANNENILFVVDINDQVWSSTNNGFTWSLINSDYNGANDSSSPNVFLVDDMFNNITIIEDDEDVWVSNNDGINFTRINTDFNGVSGTGDALGFENHHNMTAPVMNAYYIIDADENFWESNNSGVTWGLVTNIGSISNAEDLSMNHITGEFFILDGTEIWSSTNKGRNWSLRNSDFNGGDPNTGVMIIVDHDEVLHAIDSSEDVFNSVDAGLNFTQVANNFNGANGNIFGLNEYVFGNFTVQVRSGDDNTSLGSWIGSDGSTSSFWNGEDEILNLENVSDGEYFQYNISFTGRLNNSFEVHHVLINTTPIDFLSDPTSINHSLYATFPNLTREFHEAYVTCIESDIVYNSSFIYYNYTNDFTAPVLTFIHPNETNHTYNININYTYSTSEFSTCILNDTAYTDIFNNGTFFIWQETTLNNSQHALNISCTDESFLRNTDETHFNYTKDLLFPNILFIQPFNNSKWVNDRSLNLIMNITDNNDLFNINVSFIDTATGLIHFNDSIQTIGLIYEYNEYLNTSSLNNDTLYEIKVRACDSHTNNKLKKSVNIKKTKTELKFDYGKTWFKVQPKEKLKENIKTDKKFDRYTFEFNYKNNNESIKTYYLTSNSNIVYLPNSEYKGHFVIDNSYWLDFEQDGDVFVELINNTVYKIEVINPSQDIIMHSTGELNCVNNSIFVTLVKTPPPNIFDFELRTDNLGSIFLLFSLIILYLGLYIIGFSFDNRGFISFGFFIGLLIGFMLMSFSVWVTLLFVFINFSILYSYIRNMK